MFGKFQNARFFSFAFFIFMCSFERGDFMQTHNASITEISVEEYNYLTDFIDFNSGDSIKGTKFLIYNRQRKLISLVKMVMDNELTYLEREIATKHWCNEVSVENLIEEYNLSRSRVYRMIENARKKIEKSLKYVMLYDEILIPKSTEEILEYVKKYEN